MSQMLDPSNLAAIEADQLEVFGVQLRLPNSNRGNVSLEPETKTFEWNNGQLALRMVRYNVYLNGRSYGHVAEGDVLTITGSGAVAVNDEQRQPRE